VREPAGSDTTVRRAFQIYLYAVCFVTVIVVLFAGSQSVYALVRVAAPGTTAPSTGEASFEFRGGGDRSFDLERFRRAADTTTERNEGKLQLIQNGILLALALVIFLIHWGRAARLRAELERSVSPSMEPAAATPSSPGE
jgi:hypothetical protein